MRILLRNVASPRVQAFTARAMYAAAAIAGVGVVQAAPAQCPFTFATPYSYVEGGAQATGVAVGDFNADGHLDLAVADPVAGSVFVFLGKGPTGAPGDGTYAAPVRISVTATYGAVALATGDVNRDGKLDLVVADSGGNQMCVLLGRGDGTFAVVPQRFAVGAAPGWVAVGDFDRDGTPDMVVTNSGGGTVSVLRGNGDGTFQGAVSYAVGASPWFVAVGDVDADGILDLAVANRSSGTGPNNISVLLGNADGTFRPAVGYASGGGPTCVAIGDVSGDGTPDLVAANFTNPPSVSVLQGTGTGTFQAAVSYPTGPSPALVGLTDLDGDGRLDIVTAHQSGGSNLSVLINGGGGVFLPPTTFAVGATHGLAIADLNGDGRSDVVLTTQCCYVTVLFGSVGQPTITVPPAFCQVVQAGQPLTLSVAAANPAMLSYQWRKDGTPLTSGGRVSGATTSTLTVNPAVDTDSGAYTVQISAPACGGIASVISSAAIVVVSGTNPCAPSITQQPASQSVSIGAAAAFTVGATAAESGGILHYQWRLAGTSLVDDGRITGASTATLHFDPVTVTDDGSALDCVVTNDCGQIISNPAGLGVPTTVTSTTGACCQGAACTVAAGSAACVGGMYLGDGSVCSPMGRGGPVNVCCPTDANNSGQLEIADVFAYLNAWFAGCP